MLKVLHIKLSATYFTRDNIQQLKGGVSVDHSNQSSECLLMSPLIMTTLSSQVSPSLLQHSLQSDGAGELHTALCPQEGQDYCTVLYCTVLYCIVLYCIVLYCIVLYCIVLYCTYSTGLDQYTPLVEVNQAICAWSFRQKVFWVVVVVVVGDIAIIVTSSRLQVTL